MSKHAKRFLYGAGAVILACCFIASVIGMFILVTMIPIKYFKYIGAVIVGAFVYAVGAMLTEKSS